MPSGIHLPWEQTADRNADIGVNNDREKTRPLVDSHTLRVQILLCFLASLLLRAAPLATLSNGLLEICGPAAFGEGRRILLSKSTSPVRHQGSGLAMNGAPCLREEGLPAPVSPLDPLLVGLSPSNPNRHGRGSQYTALGYTWQVLIQTLALPLVNSTWPSLAKSRCSTQQAGVFSNPSVDAEEGMAWHGKGLWWAGACLGCRLSPRVKGPGPQSEPPGSLVLAS